MRRTSESPRPTPGFSDAPSPRTKGSNLEELLAYERARRLDMLGRSAEARDAYVDCANRWPYPKGAFFDDSLYRASEMEEKLGRPKEAIDHLERLLSYREKSTTIGSYERPRYVPAVLRIAKLYEERLNDRGKARDALHRLYSEFTTSTLRDDALFDCRRVAGHRQITDLLLLGLAQQRGGSLATFDRTVPVRAVVGARQDLVEVIAPADEA